MIPPAERKSEDKTSFESEQVADTILQEAEVHDEDTPEGEVENPDRTPGGDFTSLVDPQPLPLP